jgi:hypothetical protein
MTPSQPDSDPGAHVREQVRGIITAEDLACLGVKARPPIPVSDEERVALERLRQLGGAGLEPKPPGRSGSSGSPSGSSGSSGSSG